jgi:hypothetical protein
MAADCTRSSMAHELRHLTGHQRELKHPASHRCELERPRHLWGELKVAGSNNSSPKKKIHASARRKPSAVRMRVSIRGSYISPSIWGSWGLFFGDHQLMGMGLGSCWSKFFKVSPLIW